jgi:hypothetical protein
MTIVTKNGQFWNSKKLIFFRKMDTQVGAWQAFPQLQASKEKSAEQQKKYAHREAFYCTHSHEVV